MMKKFLIGLLVCILCVTPLLPVTGYAAVTGTLTGPSTVRAGDTITLTFKIKGSGIKAFSGTLSYDSTQVTLSSVKKSVADPWSLTTNGNELMLADENLSAPINKETALFTATFKVKSDLKTGTKLSISLTDGTASTGSAETVAKATYSATIAAPKSTDNKLKSLTVSNGTLSPAFQADTISYSMTVPYSVSKLDIKATASDSKASVAIDSPNLVVGNNTATVTVTSESGAKKTYTIKVKREQDPNYVPSDNANLSGIQIDGFLLSPVFSADVTEYLVWLPYETESITVSGTPADKKASVAVQGGDALEAGADNPIKVICTAENGTSTKEYTVIAKRAPAHGSQDVPDEPTDDPVDDPADNPANDPTLDNPGTDDPSGDAPTTPPETPTVPDPLADGAFSWQWLAGVGAGALVFGLLFGFLLGKRKSSGKH